MTIQPDEVLQKQGVGKSQVPGAQKIVFDGRETNAAVNEIVVSGAGSDPIVKDGANNSSSIEVVDDNEALKPLPEELPEWYSSLDEVSRVEVRHLCEEAGLPPSDPEVLSKLQIRFNVNENEAAVIVELFFEGKLQGKRGRLKSILKTRDEDEGPPLRKQQSWSDENGGKLTQTHEMETWHYMDSKRNSPPPCCSIL